MPHRIVLAAIAAFLLPSCDDSGPPTQPDASPCPYGTVPECVEFRFGWCVGIVPPMPDGRICAGGQVAQCVPNPPVPCVLEDDCPDASGCMWRDTGSVIGYCTPTDAGTP